MKFKPGALVCRRKDVFDPKSPLRFGTITQVYSDYTSRLGPYPELYEVTWGDGQVERGFLPHGLDPAT